MLGCYDLEYCMGGQVQAIVRLSAIAQLPVLPDVSTLRSETGAMVYPVNTIGQHETTKCARGGQSWNINADEQPTKAVPDVQ